MRATVILALAACTPGGSLGLFGGGGTTSASAAPAAGRAPAAAPKPTSSGARVSSERPAVRPDGGYAMTDAQRDADPTGDLIYPIVPLGTCADPGPVEDQSRRPGSLPYPTRPADPWHALASSRVPAALPIPEKRLAHTSVYARTEPATCDAAHDHCFRDCTWLVRDSQIAGVRTFSAFPAHLRPDGFWSRPSSTNRYYSVDGYLEYNFRADADAYRTIPATLRLLAPGVTIAVHDTVPASEREAMEPWRIGKLREIDREHQTVSLMGAPDVYPLSATRIVVFVSHQNGAIEMLGDWKPADLTVTAAETVAVSKESP